jgi:hypothetical protein
MLALRFEPSAMQSLNVAHRAGSVAPSGTAGGPMGTSIEAIIIRAEAPGVN